MPSISVSIVCGSILFMVSLIVSVGAITIMIASITSFGLMANKKKEREKFYYCY